MAFHIGDAAHGDGDARHVDARDADDAACACGCVCASVCCWLDTEHIVRQLCADTDGTSGGQRQQQPRQIRPGYCSSSWWS